MFLFPGRIPHVKIHCAACFFAIAGYIILCFFCKPERWLSGRRRRSRKPLTGFSRSGVRIPLSPPSSCSVPSRFSNSSLFPPRRELADGTKFFRTFFPFQFAFFQTGVYIKSHARNCGGVAQLVRVPPCHGGCCGFESRRSRHFCIRIIQNGVFLYFESVPSRSTAQPQWRHCLPGGVWKRSFNTSSAI